MASNKRLVLGAVLAVVFVLSPLHASYGQSLDYDAAMQQALVARQSGDFGTAEQFFTQALQARDGDVTALRLIALMTAFQDRLDEARVYIEQAVGRAPDDVDVLLSYARILSWQEEFTAAEQVIETVVVQAPDYAEAWSLKGRISYYRQALAAAEEAFNQALALDPDNLDALLGLGDVARMRNNTEQARRFYESARVGYPNDMEVQKRLTELDAPIDHPWRIDFDAEVSRLSRTALSDWSAQTVRLENRVSATTAVYGTVSFEERFDVHDVSLLAGASSRLSETLAVYGNAGVTPNSAFLWDWQLGTGGTLRLIDTQGSLGAGLVSADTRVRHYDVGTIYTFDLGWQQYSGDGRTWVWAKVLNTIDAQDKHLTGWSVSLWRSLTDRLSVRAGYADAPDSDRGLVVDTTSYTFALEYEIEPRLFVRLGGERHSRENSYRRHVFRIGAGKRF